MLNLWHGCGRLVYDPELRTSKNGTRIVSNKVAIPASKDKTEFIRFVAFDRIADKIIQFGRKGHYLVLSGHLHGAYDKDQKKDILELIVDEVTLCENRDSMKYEAAEPEKDDDAVEVDIADDDEDLPFI